MDYRIEKDSMGEIAVAADCKWGAQTQRSLENFRIGGEKMPAEIIEALAYVKAASAMANLDFGLLAPEQARAITDICAEIAAGGHAGEFPLVVWQTGSGTQSNMNMNEVIAHLALERGVRLHPNDHVNRSQSSNDTFPAAMSIAAVLSITRGLLPALARLSTTLLRLERENEGVVKIGRTHLQDATPLRFSQEISAWREMTDESARMIAASLPHLRQLALGGTAVGTGLNAPKGFGEAAAKYVGELTGESFVTAPNKFHALTSKDAFVFAHGALKALAADLMKIANDVRWLASGPRCGIGELRIPENEPGSSIMPGKVNPTQCEAVTMVAVQVMANDVAVGMAASQGNFQLNVFMPVCAYNFLQSVRLLADVAESFEKNCLAGLAADAVRMRENLDRSLMLVTCLTPVIGYDSAAAAAKKAHMEGTTLREAVMSLGLLSGEEFDRLAVPEKMV